MRFISFTFLDFLDIFLTAFLLYSVYKLIRNTASFKIIMPLAVLYGLGKVIDAFDMKLLGSIMEYVTGLSLLIIIIVFQQDIRNFLLLINNKYLSKIKIFVETLLNNHEKTIQSTLKISEITNACVRMSREKTGALIILKKNYLPKDIVESGVRIDALTSTIMLETIFKKNAPMHDGAVVIENQRIIAAKCILPLTERKDLPAFFGLRHRAATSIAELSDSLIITVSEETGGISWFYKNNFKSRITERELKEVIEKHFTIQTEQKTSRLQKRLMQLLLSIKQR